MAENFNDYGEYSSELAYEEKTKWQKLFSFRTLGKIIKWLFYALLIFIYVFLFYRLVDNKAVGKYTDLLWTEASYARYAELGEAFPVYSYEVESSFAYDSKASQTNDGKFSVYGMRYLPMTEELQFTVRYNRSTLTALCEEYGLDAVPENMPFRFVLRDEEGTVYESAAYTSVTRGRYTYVRISFFDIKLYGGGYSAPENQFPYAVAPCDSYLYKGAGKCEENGNVPSLCLNMYYEEDYDPENDSFGMKITVYRDTYEMEKYDYGKETAEKPTENTVTVSPKSE